jgi:hypothetical protein
MKGFVLRKRRMPGITNYLVYLFLLLNLIHFCIVKRAFHRYALQSKIAFSTVKSQLTPTTRQIRYTQDPFHYTVTFLVFH